jgi:hypothetical protein
MSLQPLDESTKSYFESRGQVTPSVEPAPEPQAPSPEPEPQAPSPEPEPQAQPQEPSADTEDGNKGQYVRLGALHEERGKRRELERHLQAEREAREKLEARTNEILRRFQQEEEPQIPEWEKDPLGHTKQRIESADERLARLEREDEQRREQAQHQNDYMQFRGVVAQHTHQFMEKTPDYPQAYQHLMTMQAKALEVAGFPPEQIRATMEQFETAIAQRALHDGVNPAERAYAMAKQMGYKGAAAPSALNDAWRQSAAEQKLQNIAAGQRASASLSDAAGSAKPQLDAKTLADMPDEEFAKIWANRKQVRQILGR